MFYMCMSMLNLLTVIGFGSKIRVISFMAPSESHGGQLNSPAEICKQIENCQKGVTKPETRIVEKVLSKETLSKKSCSLSYKDSID